MAQYSKSANYKQILKLIEMKKSNKIKNVITAIMVLCLVACKKETDEFIPYTNSDFNDIEWTSTTMSDSKSKAITDALAKPIFITQFNATANTIIDVDTHTQLTIDSLSLLYNNTNYTGNATANLTKLYTKGDFIRNLISSTTTKPFFENIAAYNLNITNSSQQNLTINPNRSLLLSYADSFPGINNYIYGTMTTDKDITWTIADSANTGALQINNITIQGNNKLAYQIVTKKTGFMSVAKQIYFPTTTTCNVVLPINFTNKNTAVFAVFKNYNAVVKFTANATNKIFELFNVPIDEPVTLVALSYLDGNFYLGKSVQTITSNAHYNINTSATAISLSELNTFLNSL